MNHAQERVILLHGIASSRLSMLPLALRLKARAYQVHNWSYHTLLDAIDLPARRFYHFLQQQDSETRIHIIAHSMGCIVTRAALSLGALPHLQLGRIVFLAPPNQGVPVARWSAPLLGRVIKPIPDLADNPNSLVCCLEQTLACEVGIIAARFDWIVPERCAHLSGEADFVRLNHTHNSLLISRQVADYAVQFLEHGHF